MSGANDFDFLIGGWQVEHHRLEGRLTGATKWDIAHGTDVVEKCFLESGNRGCFKREFDGLRYEGMPLRLYDPNTDLWSIYWLDTIDHRMEPPVLGGFKNGEGLFIGDDILRGNKIKVRYRWFDIDENSATWDQAYSADQGKTWEVNSIMKFTRVEN